MNLKAIVANLEQHCSNLFDQLDTQLWLVTIPGHQPMRGAGLMVLVSCWRRQTRDAGAEWSETWAQGGTTGADCDHHTVSDCLWNQQNYLSGMFKPY